MVEFPLKLPDKKPEPPIWKFALRYLLLLIGALAVAYVLSVVGFDPFHIREIEW